MTEKKKTDFESVQKDSKRLVEYVFGLSTFPEWCHAIGVHRNDPNGFIVTFRVLPGHKKDAENLLKDINISSALEIKEMMPPRAR